MKFMDWLTRGEEREKETEFLPAILEVTESPPSPTGRLVLWSVLTLIVVAVVWSFVGHINEVAVAEGTVVPSGQSKTVQVKNKGIVQEILVKEGDIVEGIVRNRIKTGVFVELKPNVIGIAEHVNGIEAGQKVLVSIKKINVERKKVKLIIIG